MFIFMSLIIFGMSSGIISSNNFSGSFFSSWDFHCVYVGPRNGDPRIPEALFIFPRSFSFLFLRFDDVNCPAFKFTDSSACSNLPLNSSSDYFISIILIFSSRFFCFLLDFLSL